MLFLALKGRQKAYARLTLPIDGAMEQLLSATSFYGRSGPGLRVHGCADDHVDWPVMRSLIAGPAPL